MVDSSTVGRGGSVGCPNETRKQQSSAYFETPLFTYVLSTSACLHRSTKKQVIMLMRSGERFDRIFGEDWQSTEIKNNKLFRNDANMPLDIRALKFSTLENDPPITPYGRFACSLVAKGLQSRRIVPECIVSSPALRAVQSASAIADILNLSVTVNDSLCEPLAWYASSTENTSTINYLTHSQLILCGLSIVPPASEINAASDALANDETKTGFTSSLVKTNRPMDAFHSETHAEGIQRIERTLRKLFSEPREGPLLIVGHAITLMIALRIAQKSQENAEKAMDEVGKNGTKATNQENNSSGKFESLSSINHIELGVKFPYSCVVAMARANEELIYELPNLIPTLTLSPTICNEADLRV